MEHINNGYTVIGAFNSGDALKLQFGKVVDETYDIVTKKYEPDHPDFAWALEQLAALDQS